MDGLMHFNGGDTDVQVDYIVLFPLLSVYKAHVQICPK